MGRITSGVGLISGINSKDIIDQLMTLESRPKRLLETRIENTNQQKLAYTDITTRLTSLRLSATTLKKPSSFQASTTTSSDEDVLTATASNGAALGAFQFRIARLVTSQQTVSKGYVDFDSAKVGAGTITIERGGGDLATETQLSELNGGKGVRRGSFRVTDRSGASATVDITAAVSVEDVVKKINTNLGVQVKATVKGDGLILTDTTSKVVSNLIVQDLGDGHAAEDLGLVASVATTEILGTDVNFVSRDTNLSSINDGRGIRTAATGNDFTVNLGDGTSFGVPLLGKKTVGDVIDAINTAGGSKIKASAVVGSNGIQLQDLSGGGGAFSVVAVGDSKAAKDLGIETTGAAGTLTGSNVIGGINTVLLSSLNGGAGLTLGTISIQSRAAVAGVDVNLSGAKTVADAIDLINAANAGVKASINGSGNGLQIVDTSGGTGSLIIGESAGGTSGADLGIGGTLDINTPAVNGKNLQRAWVSENTLLSQYNGGKGVAPGKFKITTASGVSATIDLTQGNEIRLADVIQEINSRAIGVTARINDNGDGLLLVDTTTGTNKLKVDDDTSTTATDLGIVGSAAVDRIDGSQEKTITVTATDTLQDVQKKINDLNFGATATIINDGTGNAPYRLSLNASGTGRAGRIVFDAGATNLDTHNLVEAQDAAVFLGSAGSSQPLLVTASKNQLSGVIKGVNIELHSVSEKPVTLGVSRSSENVSKELTTFTDAFNEMIDKLQDLTKYDTETNERGLLMGESTVNTVQTEMYASLNAVVNGGGKYRTLSSIGLTVASGGKLAFDEDKFNEEYGDNPQAVQSLFATLDTPVAASSSLSRLNNGAGVRTAGAGVSDIRFLLRDGSQFDVSLSSANTLANVLDAINTGAPGKITAALGADGNITLKDLTRGSKPFVASSFNGSKAVEDLGLNVKSDGGDINGRRLDLSGKFTNNAGAGFQIEQAINRLIDPANGVVPRQNKSLDSKADGFKSRIESLDKLIEGKRSRLERQFANMESVLAGLQDQQKAIGQIQTISG
ncbi:MAG: flagellar filament capping protein FliD [Anaerolineae bacterium]|nr:flagellar filament capping protein FliD [Phycisphaerae bacterium]